MHVFCIVIVLFYCWGLKKRNMYGTSYSWDTLGWGSIKRISELYFFIQFARLLDTYLLCFTYTDLECPFVKYSTTYDSLYYIITVVISQIPTRQYEQLAKVLTVYLRPKLFKPKKYQFVINEVKINVITPKPNWFCPNL